MCRVKSLRKPVRSDMQGQGRLESQVQLRIWNSTGNRNSRSNANNRNSGRNNRSNGNGNNNRSNRGNPECIPMFLEYPCAVSFRVSVFSRARILNNRHMYSYNLHQVLVNQLSALQRTVIVWGPK